MVWLTSLTMLVLGLPAVLVHLGTVALTKALQSYSRSRLEECCDGRKRPGLAGEVGRLAERTEQAAEAVAVVSGLFLVALLGIALERWSSPPRLELVVPLVLVVAILGYVAAGVLGRVFAEPLLVFCWPAASSIRILAWPVTAAATGVAYLVERFASNPESTPRPMSVEVEIDAEEGETPEEVEAELPDEAHDLLQRAVGLTRTSVSEVMIPASAIVSLPATVTAREAAEAFRTSGRSRIPIFRTNRDDIVGILLGKDLWEKMVHAEQPETVVPAELVRPPYRVPETSNAYNVIEGLKRHRTGMAIVLDEYGGVAGLVTLEDLLEELVGPIDDEHDTPGPADSILPLDDSRFDVDASLPLDDLNRRLRLHLPTEADYETIGGLALHILGRLPEKGEKFRRDGIEFTVLDVREQAIRRILIDLQPGRAAVGASNGLMPSKER